MKIEINYSDLVRNYNKQLTKQLRDFGENHLKYWIPDDNIYLSISKLIFSIHNSNYSEIILNINSDENSEKIYSVIKKFSECFHEQKDTLHTFYITKILTVWKIYKAKKVNCLKIIKKLSMRK